MTARDEWKERALFFERCLEWVGRVAWAVTNPTKGDPNYYLEWTDSEGKIHRGYAGANFSEVVRLAVQMSEEPPADLPSLESDSALLVGWMLERDMPWVRPEEQDLEEALERCRDRLPSEESPEHTMEGDLGVILAWHTGICRDTKNPNSFDLAMDRIRERMKEAGRAE